jgi:hypothetical protein
MRVLKAARRGCVWEKVTEDLGVKYTTAPGWVHRHVTLDEPVHVRPRSAGLLLTNFVTIGI